ncbi:hypothetical protein MelnitzEXVC044M_171 [Methylophilales phage Melnitz EXVC044M]|nr:hypothetical protein Melnitz1EXVC043M_170 [Methylophilales phage Melnitz-1 EXVC043M]QZI94675.1 hypothetical protein Melnitz2EXVC040M_171 [Methylophilales phage Melnitz-2 EXVC040M]QZI94897.1 hypothetical protein MelnitzEXVC044M_171 [Methylophilales phage Melnitz EXVC044M]QZI95118.1 hypothetical protein Melnitz3EXVC039M_171 [Methylophilales phage Melnitz-3 EXVC039M]
MASKSKIIAELFEADGDIIASALDNVVVTPAAVSDTANTSTGAFDIPSGTTAQRPGSPSAGYTRFNTNLGVMENYDGSSWLKVSSALAVLSSVTGNIINTAANSLTLAGTGFLTANLVVSFTPSGGSATTVTVTPSSDTAATVAVPSGIYGQSAGVVIGVKVTNSDSSSSATINKTVLALPSGGTVTTSGSTRIHTFNSSGTLTIPTGYSLTAQVLMAAGGGGGGTGGGEGGGGGAGGLLWYSGSTVDGKSPNGGTVTLNANKTIVIGAGGNGASQYGVNGGNGTAGSNTTVTGLTNALGGGIGGNYPDNAVGAGNGTDGGSGGGAGANNSGNGYSRTGGSGTSGQGNDGGDGVTSGGIFCGGGGGGSKTAGENGGTDGTGHGGDGGSGHLFSSLYGTGWGSSGGVCGGGGANTNGGTDGVGGTHGGANNGNNASANTGGGGGASGGNGGSGTVVISYVL